MPPADVLGPSDRRAILDSLPGRFLVLGVDLRIVAATDDYLAVVGRGRDDLIGRDVGAVFVDGGEAEFVELAAELRRSLARAAESERPVAMPARRVTLRRSDGRLLDRHWSAVNAAVRDEHGRVRFLVHRLDDLSALHRVTSLLDAIVEHIPDMIFVKEAEGLTFERLNRAGEELLGLDRAALIGKTDLDVFPREQAETYRAADRATLAAGAMLEVPEEPIQTPRGVRWLHTKKVPIAGADGKPAYLLGISSDVTEARRAREQLRSSHDELERRVAERTAELVRESAERRLAEDALMRSQQQLSHAQKMEAVGRLAGGIAHDFNNMLSVIITYADLVGRVMPADDPLRAHVQEIARAGARAADLTRQLLTFSRHQVVAQRLVDLGRLVREMAPLLERTIGEDVAVVVEIAPGTHGVRADPSQLEQVVMNLALNARDAMASGGRLAIEIAPVFLDEAYTREHLGSRTGPHIALRVSDTGCGMDAATAARIFEPFFTTKPAGKGTGLGLATVFGTVGRCGGTIAVDSAPGQGSRFEILLPEAAEEPEPEREPAVGDHRGRETILLVEDEPQVREAARTVLVGHGYAVLVARSAAEALGLAREHPTAIDLLLSDVVMPGMNGFELARRIAALRPTIKVLCMSGYTDESIAKQGRHDPGIAFLQKPFTSAGLARRLRQVLDER